MVKARYYPPADRTTQWHGEGAVTMPRIDKLEKASSATSTSAAISTAIRAR